MLHLIYLAKTLAETRFCQDGLNWFKPLMAETCQTCTVMVPTLQPLTCRVCGN